MKVHNNKAARKRREVYPRMGTPALLSLVFLCVLCASVVSPASAQTTITGTVKDASGTALTSGTIIFTLSQEGTVSDPALLVVQPVVTCTITNGVIGTCSLRGNDEISPAGTFYRVRIISSGGRTFLPERRYTISGATWDIGTSTPLASDTIAAQAYQIVQDEGANLTQRQKLNFTGAGVSCVDNSTDARTDCAITGGGGGGSTHQIDGVALTTQDPINFLDTSEFDWTNPAAGSLSLALKAASVADSKLAQITTASKVSGAALTSLGSVPAGAGDLPDANIPAAIARDSELHAQVHGAADHTGDVIPAANQNFGAFYSDFGEIAAPANPSAGVVRVYAKTGSGELCSRDSAGTENCMSTGSGGVNHNILSSTHSDTTAAAVVRGDLMVGQSATPSWQRLALGTGGQVLRSDGTDALWATLAKSDLPAAIAYEDEANIFTVAGGLTMDNQFGLRLRELTANGTNYIEHRAVADAGAGNTTYTWPATTDSRFLFSGTAGALSWNQASGVGACGANNFVTGSNNNAAPTCAQPAFSNLSGSATDGQVPDNITIATQDNNFSLLDDLDNTKVLAFQLSSITTGTTRTVTVPDANGEMSLLGQTIDDGELASNYSGVGSCTNQFVRATVDNAAPTCATVGTADIANNAITDALLRDSAATSIIGRSAGTTGDPADIAAALDGQVLRRAAGALGFGALDLADTDAVTGLLPDANIAASISRDTEAPGAGDIGGSLSAGYTINAGAVASAELATANKTFVQPVVLFDSTGLLDADDIPSVFRPGRAITITEVWCETDAGTPSVNLQRDDGTPADVLSSNLTCTTGGATGTIAGAEDNVAATERIDFVMVSASTAKRISLMIKYTVD